MVQIADQHNSNIPALTNQVAEDIPDIKENLEFHKDAFERIIETWSDSDNSSAKLDTVPGFNNGTYNFEFPTNGVGAHSVFMLGTSDTIVWMYLNAAPPGWKALATGADMVCGISGGADAYNVNGGNPDSEATWAVIDAAHNHLYFNYASPTGTRALSTPSVDAGATYNSGGTKIDFAAGNNADYYTANETITVNSWRVPASVGKLFQLDTA